jgi:hypothetical protein
LSLFWAWKNRMEVYVLLLLLHLLLLLLLYLVSFLLLVSQWMKSLQSVLPSHGLSFLISCQFFLFVIQYLAKPSCSGLFHRSLSCTDQMLFAVLFFYMWSLHGQIIAIAYFLILFNRFWIPAFSLNVASVILLLLILWSVYVKVIMLAKCAVWTSYIMLRSADSRHLEVHKS